MDKAVSDYNCEIGEETPRKGKKNYILFVYFAILAFLIISLMISTFF
jgi:hypothetical protein